MKRRGFLQMLGGALAAPLMPSASLGAASKAAYPASALHAAIYHAKSRVNFSVFSLSRQLGLDLGQAEQLMSDMSARGILGPLQGTTQSGRWAISKVWQRPFADAAAAQRLARGEGVQSRSPLAKADPNPQWREADLRPFLSNLHRMAENHGLTLHPRCAAMLA